MLTVRRNSEGVEFTVYVEKGAAMNTERCVGTLKVSKNASRRSG